MDLDDAYANIPYIQGAETFIANWPAEAALFRDHLTQNARAQPGIAYGPGPRQAFDLFLPDGPAQGLCVFVHGGYWLKFDRSFWSHFAAGPLGRGWAVAMPSYDLCPAVAIADITRQVAAAITAAARQIDGPIALAGHSAGGHLVARAGADGMLPADVAARLQHILPISPVSDLRPLIRTSMNADFKLTPASAAAESPALHPAPAAPVSIWVGAGERPVFLDQARWLAAAWDAPLSVAKGKHHFDIIDAFADPGSAMIRALLSPDQT